MKATVVITHFNDPRITRTLASLDAQRRQPDHVLVADGGSTDGSDDQARQHDAPYPLQVASMPGSVAETRAQAVPAISDDVVVFLDTDQAAPTEWLECLLEPLERGDTDVSGGPTQPWARPTCAPQQYIQDFEAWFYETIVAQDPWTLPMGNSAWRRDVFETAGNFDPRLRWGGEDYDMNLRARNAGLRVRYVPEAWVYHDQSHLDTWAKVMRRKYRYQKGAAMAYLKNGALAERARASGSVLRFPHPAEWAGMALRPVALASAWAAWRRVSR